MQRQTVDVFISGGGPAGLTAAAGFGNAGFSVLLADPVAPVTVGDKTGSDLRSTAFLQPAQHLFGDIGLWDALAPHAVPLQSLRIVDTAGEPPMLRGERAFRSDDIGDGPLGWNFLNWVFRREILDYLRKQPGVDLRFGTGFRSLLTRTSGAIVTLSDGTSVAARLVIAADGRASPLREAVGIGCHITRYGQKSLAFTATHVHPHDNISTEIYHRGGPFTMVPLADLDGKPASAIVWMNSGRRATDLLAMAPDAFNAEMTRRSASLFGPMELASERAMFPIVTQRAERLVGQRTAIVAEAAHVLPPIGAQGLNTSLNDIAALLQAARANPDGLGEPAMLRAYERARSTDIARRARIIDLFNRITRSGDLGLQGLRLIGLKAAHDIRPLRRALMRTGMGPV
jgi:2-octaprenyl-6-methoxyphenol hydroxylase